VRTTKVCLTSGRFYRTIRCGRERLAEQGCDEDEEDENEARPLHYASARGHATTVELLLSKGAHVNSQGGKYGSALQAASEGGHTKIDELLLSKEGNTVTRSRQP
jgi:ankyrin repeat protein